LHKTTKNKYWFCAPIMCVSGLWKWKMKETKDKDIHKHATDRKPKIACFL
jgi:hypothetical protein